MRRQIMNISTAVLVGVCMWPLIGHAAQETVPEVVRKQRGPVEFRIHREFSPVDLPDLIKAGDLIARVVVIDGGRTRLSDDQRSMYSEYTLQILDGFFSRQPLKPGENIVVRKPGGAMKIDGHQITSIDSDFPPFEMGEEYILFLAFDASTGQYVLPYGAQSAFRNTAGTIEQVSNDTGTWNQNRGRVPTLSFIQELTGILESR